MFYARTLLAHINRTKRALTPREVALLEALRAFMAGEP